MDRMTPYSTRRQIDIPETSKCNKDIYNNNNNNNNNNKYLFTHKSIIFKNAVIDFKWVLTTWNNHRG